MTANILVKEYSSEYQSQVIDLILQIQQVEYNIPITKEDQPDLYNIENFYQNGIGNFWVALYEGSVVGTIALLDIGDGKVALRKMFVAQEFRGKRYQVSHQLLHNAITWAEEKRIKEIYLGTTAQYIAAHKFYEKNGFISVPIEELPSYFPIMKVDTRFYKYTIQ